MEPAEGERRQQQQQSLENQGRPLRQEENEGPRPTHQRCPRCDSDNTKFCYFNNYSVTQPRYYCKNCRRYWTQGGTLRNVPIGGSCRKNKRARILSSFVGDFSRSIPPPPLPSPPQLQPLQVPQGLASLQRAMLSATLAISSSESLRSKESGKLGLPPIRPYYTDAGIFSSLVAMRSIRQSPPINPTLNIVSQFGGASSFSLFPGLDVPPFSSQQDQVPQHIQQQQSAFYQTGNQNHVVKSLFQSDEIRAQASRPNASWTTSFVNDINPTLSPLPSPTSYRDSSNVPTSVAAATSGTALNPDEWADFEGYILPS